jgi:hypothetical protein
MSAPARQLATVADLLAIPEDHRFHELIGGEIVRKAMPSAKHGGAQASLAAVLFRRYGRRPGGRFPGGWWFATEVEIQFAEHELYRSDVSGWAAESPGSAAERVTHRALAGLGVRDPQPVESS